MIRDKLPACFKVFKTPHKKVIKHVPAGDLLFLGEDDLGMRELLPVENADFIRIETARLNEASANSFYGTGYKSISVVQEGPVKTSERNISLKEFCVLCERTGLHRQRAFNLQGVGIIDHSATTIWFGTHKYAAICETEGDHIQKIWLTGYARTEEEQFVLKTGIILLS